MDLNQKGVFPLCNINGVIWSGYSLLSSVYCVCFFCEFIGLVQSILFEDKASIL
jgi:hypothetical protein